MTIGMHKSDDELEGRWCEFPGDIIVNLNSKL